jgi:hypothetical protein
MALLKRLLAFCRFGNRSKAKSDLNSQALSLERAQNLIASIDQGGIPLSPIIVNRIARNLGLMVAPSDSMDQTIARIRALLANQQ